MKTKIVIGLLVLFLGGCHSAYLKYTPVRQTNDVRKTFIVDENYDKTWTTVVRYFATNNIELDKIEKTSGLIWGKKYYGKVELWDELRCPKLIGRGNIETNVVGDINILIEKETQKTTRVTVNVFGHMSASAYKRSKFSGAATYANVNNTLCVSSGKIEEDLFGMFAK